MSEAATYRTLRLLRVAIITTTILALVQLTVDLASGQDIKISSVDNLDVGRLKVLEISADKDGKPADSILIDVQGELDYQLFENNSKFVLVPTKVGKIRLKCVAIWFELKIATQTVKEITAVSAAETPDPAQPDDPASGDFKQLTLAVEILSKQVADPTGKSELSKTYSLLSKAVANSAVYEQDYLGKAYSYDFADSTKLLDNVNQAISRSIAASKATNKETDAIDYNQLLLQPIKHLSDDFDLTKRKPLSSFLQAVADGVK